MTLSAAVDEARSGPAAASSSRARRMAGPVGVAAAAVAAVGLLAVVDPNEPGHYPLCPTRALTGLDCPGCGGLRCVHALVTGRPVDALDHNLLAVLVMPVLVLAWFAWARRSWSGWPRPAPVSRLVVVLFGAAVAAFTIARNIPGMPFLGSGLG